MRSSTVYNFSDPLPPTLYWDASFIVNATYEAARYLHPCADFLARLDEQTTVSYVSTLALDEAWFVLLQLKIEEDYGTSKFWNVYNDDPGAIQPYIDDLQTMTETMTTHPQIQVIGTDPGAAFEALSHMRTFHFLPRDAYHLAVMQHHGIDNLVTTDADFTVVPKINLYTCNPAILSRQP